MWRSGPLPTPLCSSLQGHANIAARYVDYMPNPQHCELRDRPRRLIGCFEAYPSTEHACPKEGTEHTLRMRSIKSRCSFQSASEG
jgi:hypothetical protein